MDRPGRDYRGSDGPERSRRVNNHAATVGHGTFPLPPLGETGMQATPQNPLRYRPADAPWSQENIGLQGAARPLPADLAARLYAAAAIQAQLQPQQAQLQSQIQAQARAQAQVQAQVDAQHWAQQIQQFQLYVDQSLSSGNGTQSAPGTNVGFGTYHPGNLQLPALQPNAGTGFNNGFFSPGDGGLLGHAGHRPTQTPAVSRPPPSLQLQGISTSPGQQLPEQAGQLDSNDPDLLSPGSTSAGFPSPFGGGGLPLPALTAQFSEATSPTPSQNSLWSAYTGFSQPVATTAYSSSNSDTHLAQADTAASKQGAEWTEAQDDMLWNARENNMPLKLVREEMKNRFGVDRTENVLCKRHKKLRDKGDRPSVTGTWWDPVINNVMSKFGVALEEEIKTALETEQVPYGESGLRDVRAKIEARILKVWKDLAIQDRRANSSGAAPYGNQRQLQ